MHRRLLTLDDLYDYFVANKMDSFHFSSNEADKNLVVQVDGTVNFKKSEDDTEGLQPVVLQSSHIGSNRNKSAISEKSMKAALPSFANRPIMGYIHEVDGKPQFYAHNMHIDENDEVVYDERPVGVIPESGNPHLEYDEEKDKTYAVVNGYIFEEYSKAAEILKREEKCSCSVELSIREMSYDSKAKVLNLENFYFSGVTILGVDEDGNEVQPGMEGANITIADFSEQNNSMFSNDKLIETLEKLNNTLSNFNIDNYQRKEECAVNNFDETNAAETEEVEVKVEEAEETVVEEVTVEELSEESENAEQKEAFADDDPAEPTEPDSGTTEPDSGTDDPAGTEPTETDEDGDGVDDDYAVVTEDGDNNAKLDYEYTVSNDGKVKTFSVSLSQIAGALNTLVNDMYSESDNTWYFTEVYPDDKEVVMIDGWTGAAFRQSYKVRNEVYSLVGERVPVHACYLTDDEEKRLDDIKSKYSQFEEVSEKLEKYESEPDKMEILNSADYANIADVKEFSELKKMDNHFDMSVEEVKKAADDMLLEFAKGNKLSFAAKDEEAPKKDFFAFARIEHKTDFLDGLLQKK